MYVYIYIYRRYDNRTESTEVGKKLFTAYVYSWFLRVRMKTVRKNFENYVYIHFGRQLESNRHNRRAENCWEFLHVQT